MCRFGFTNRRTRRRRRCRSVALGNTGGMQLLPDLIYFALKFRLRFDKIFESRLQCGDFVGGLGHTGLLDTGFIQTMLRDASILTQVSGYVNLRHMSRTIKAPIGIELSCKNWLIEAAYRMIQNNLDAEVAFDPDNLIVYGGRGKAARNWESFDAILKSLRELNEDETLLIQSGKPVGIFKSHTDAPRVLLANSNIVPHWATQEQFDAYERDGLMLYGQMTAGSWIYIGTQGILQGTYETFGSLARQHGWGDLSRRLVLTAGLGEMGGAQAQAITFNGGVGILVEVDPWRIERRLQLKQVDVAARDLDHAIELARAAVAKKEATSIALLGNAAEVHWTLIERNIVPDVVTDQTSAHDVLYGYIPTGLNVDEAKVLRESDPIEYEQRAMDSMSRHVEAMLEFKNRGAGVFDYGNNLRQRALDNGVT